MADTPIITPRMARAVEKLRAGEIEIYDRREPRGPKDWSPPKVTKRGIGWRLRADLIGAGMFVKGNKHIHPNRRYRTLEYDDGEPTARGMTYGVLLDREGLIGFVQSQREAGKPKHWVASLTGRFFRADLTGYRYETRDEAALAIVRRLREAGRL